jgi:2',3'-cyclic-nucleotide 2'-phosphodiesterase (5'-nucleotidase family)
VGNHDFDFGVPQLRKLTSSCHFPWLFSNVLYADGSSPDPLEQWRVITDHPSGLKIGVIGLVEE